MEPRHDRAVYHEPSVHASRRRVKIERRPVGIRREGLVDRGEYSRKAIIAEIVERPGAGKQVEVGPAIGRLDARPRSHRLHCIDRAEDLGMTHAEADRAIAADPIPGHAARIPAGKRGKISVDIGHQLAHHEIFPIPGGRRIDVPGATGGRGEISRHHDQIADHAGADCGIEQFPCAMAGKGLGVILEEVVEEVEHRETPRSICIVRRQIDGDVAERRYADPAVGEAGRPQLSRHQPAMGLGHRRCREQRQQQPQQ